MRVLRVYHGGRDPAHRKREAALVAAGIELTLVVPRRWEEDGAERQLSPTSFRVIELDVSRSGDVNRHAFVDEDALRDVIDEVSPDVLDIHEEPFSVATRQWLAAAPTRLPVVGYAAQNVDKRWPPPFAAYERRAYRRLVGLYPCSRQAASAARGKGFECRIEVIPLGFDPRVMRAGRQSLDNELLTIAVVGRMVVEKGIRDAVRVLEDVRRSRAARLVLAGSGPEAAVVRSLAAASGIEDCVEFRPWLSITEVAELYRSAHIVLTPSVPTATWTEQFGRVAVEAQASGAVVAGYATGAIPEVGGDAALLVAPGDASALGLGVRALLNDPSGYARRRALGLALSAERDWDAVARRQIELYEMALAGSGRRALPRSPRERRAIARSEFGDTADTTSGLRPFALPILRKGGAIPSTIGAAIDWGAEVRARLPGRDAVRGVSRVAQ